MHLACEEAFGERYELGLWLQPTTPLRRPADVERTLAQMLRGGFDSPRRRVLGVRVGVGVITTA